LLEVRSSLWRDTGSVWQSHDRTGLLVDVHVAPNLADLDHVRGQVGGDVVERVRLNRRIEAVTHRPSIPGDTTGSAGRVPAERSEALIRSGGRLFPV
jgi:hypothetical protein